MTDVRELRDKWMKDPAFQVEYEALEPEFSLASALIKARGKARLSQKEVAERMGTSQAAVARLESGRGNPSTKTLERFARAVGFKLRISFEPGERRSNKPATRRPSAA